MISHLFPPHQANLAEAKESLRQLMPHLPFPRTSEQLDCCGIRLPIICKDDNLPTQEQPRQLVENLSPFVRRILPENWLVAYNEHKLRFKRNAQLLSLHSECMNAGVYVPAGLDSKLDPVVAGVLLLAAKPPSGQLRSALLDYAIRNWWGVYFATRGTVMPGEEKRLLRGISNEPRLMAALWTANPWLALPLAPIAMTRNDLWSSIVALKQPMADQWLDRICLQAKTDALAAVTALSLQPSAPNDIKRIWIQCLQSGHPRLAYLAARWTRITWPQGWENLRDQLKARAISDHGLSWYNWFRTVEPSLADEALGANDVEVLWAAELIFHSGNHGQDMKRRLKGLHSNPKEARLALEWLKRRKRPLI